MGKEKQPRRIADNEAMAVSRMLRTSPQKLNLVAQMIRNKPVGKALTDLTFSKKRISDEVKKTLQSAIANAENNHAAHNGQHEAFVLLPVIVQVHD
jgi:large subunit ribosomal protein L22